MKIKLLAFGQITEVTGKSNWEEILVEDTDVLKSQLEAKFPALANTTYSIAVNKDVIQQKTTLTEGDTVALLPPFSGG